MLLLTGSRLGPSPLTSRPLVYVVPIEGVIVLENPNHFSKNILARGLDAGTAYEILSIGIGRSERW